MIIDIWILLRFINPFKVIRGSFQILHTPVPSHSGFFSGGPVICQDILVCRAAFPEKQLCQ